MSRARLTVYLHPVDLQKLRTVAQDMAMTPGTFAARLIELGLGSVAEPTSQRPSSALLEWLGPILDDLRAKGGWKNTITAEMFDKVRDEAMDLYELAAAEMDRVVLNREIGRFVRERLRARVITRNGKPSIIKVPPANRSLVTGVTLLEPSA